MIFLQSYAPKPSSPQVNNHLLPMSVQVPSVSRGALPSALLGLPRYCQALPVPWGSGQLCNRPWARGCGRWQCWRKPGCCGRSGGMYRSHLLYESVSYRIYLCLLYIFPDFIWWHHECEIQRPGVDLPGAPGSGLQHALLPAEPVHPRPLPVPHGPLLAAVPQRRPLFAAPADGEQPQLRHRPRA